MDIILSYPKWYIFLCIALGVGYALLFYYREKYLTEINPAVKYILAFFRGMAVFFLAFLLLEPLLKAEYRTVEKPVIVIAQDNSESVLLSGDSVFYRTAYLAQIENLKNSLSQKYDVRTYTIGQKTRENLAIDYKDKLTDLSSVFEELYTKYYGRNLGAVILASDGIYNAGAQPVSFAKKLKHVPVFTIAMGDTTIRKDIGISDVAFNHLAYLGNEFPVEVMLDARKCEGERVEVKILSGENVIALQEINITGKAFTKIVPFKLEARKTGLAKYSIQVTELDGELTYLNNRKDIFIEVLDSKQKILLLANSPHPDINAIKAALSVNKNYEVKSRLIGEFDMNISTYSLIILHQLPSSSNAVAPLIEKIYQAKIPVLFVLGSQSNLPAFNNLNTGLSFSSLKGSMSNANGMLNRGFSLFTISENTQRIISKLPPLHVPFGEMNVSNAVNTLFHQKIGSVETTFPLIFFNKEGEMKKGVIAGEGIWRWKLKEYTDNGNSDIVNEVIQKSVQFLAARENKSYFRVFAKNNYPENEPVIIDAELYNESYELINKPEVVLEIVNEKGKKFTPVFSRTTNAYRVDAGKLPVGQYNYTATAKINGKTLTASGRFSISAVLAELASAVANHQMLFNLSAETGGQMVYPRETDKLLSLIETKADIVEVSHVQPRLSDLLNIKWIFFLLLALLTFEWVMRKRAGAY